MASALNRPAGADARTGHAARHHGIRSRRRGGSLRDYEPSCEYTVVTMKHPDVSRLERRLTSTAPLAGNSSPR